MRPHELRQARQALGLTQAQLAEALRTTRMTITRYEAGTRRIPGTVQVAVEQLAAVPRIQMAGTVAAGEPIEPIPQTEQVEVPPTMLRGARTFALRVKGESMKDEGICCWNSIAPRKRSRKARAPPRTPSPSCGRCSADGPAPGRRGRFCVAARLREVTALAGRMALCCDGGPQGAQAIAGSPT